MTYTTKLVFIDANVFILRWGNPKIREFIDSLSSETHCTSVLVLAEVYHKLKQKNIENIFDYVRGIMGAIKVFNFTQQDLFDALKDRSDLNINDKIHVAVMKNNDVRTIVSYDGDFDREKTIKREEI